MHIGQLLKIGRLAAGLEQGTVAGLAGCSKTYLSLIEGGRRQPSEKLRLRLFEAVFGDSMSAPDLGDSSLPKEAMNVVLTLLHKSAEVGDSLVSREEAGNSCKLAGVKRIGHLVSVLRSAHFDITEDDLLGMQHDLRAISQGGAVVLRPQYYRPGPPGVKKADGSPRVLEVSIGRLKKLQRRLHFLLCKYPFHSNQFGSLPRRGSLDNAKCHAGAKELLLMDISDFFGSTGRGLVVQTLRKRLNMSYEVAGLIADLVTLEGKLPQGTPSSPLIAALCVDDSIAKRLDTWAKRNRVRATLYVDDIAVSSSRGALPASAERHIRRIVTTSGYVVKDEKVKPLRVSDGRRELNVTGFSVYGGVDCRASDLVEVRARVRDLAAKRDLGEPIDQGEVQSLRGKIGHVRMGNGKAADDLESRLNRALSGSERVVQKTGVSDGTEE
jgi:transcriptional regulator with XRE-family HTH domain